MFASDARPIVVVGLGQLGAVFALGWLRSGRPVCPVTRSMRLADWMGRIAEPQLVLVAVAEDDLHAALDSVPERWRERVALVQNELLPRDWLRHGIARPTVAVVWFEKKPGRPIHELLPTALLGPHAALLAGSLTSLGVATARLESEDDLVFELVRKNLYILTTNIAGLQAPGSVRALWDAHHELTITVARDVIALQARLTQRSFSEGDLLHDLARAIDADPEHAATGRSAPRRLARALAQAREFGLSLPALESIAASAGVS
jgi:hypothetical protein